MITPLALSPLGPRPLVSVLISNYNYGMHLPSAVTSLLEQTYDNFEVLICDDGSTDDSRDVIGRQEARDPRVRGLYKQNGGQASAWNHAYSHASGEIICLLDPDDRFLPAKLSTLLRVYARNPGVGFAYHRSQHVDTAGQPLGLPGPPVLASGWLLERAMQGAGRGFGVATSQLSLRREVAEKVFPLPETVTYFGDAYIESVVQFLTEVAGLPEVLTHHLFHGDNHSASIQPREHSVRRLVQGHKAAFSEARAFVERQFGPEYAHQLQLSRLGPYWEQAAGLYVLSGKPEDGVEGLDRDDIMTNLPAGRRRYIWRLLFALPAPVSRRLLNQWWAKTGWKRFTRPVTSRLGLRAERW